jgi:DNA-binding NtrC family response regulator
MVGTPFGRYLIQNEIARGGMSGLSRTQPQAGLNNMTSLSDFTNSQSVLGKPFIFASRSMRELVHSVQQVARSNASVLITGESGSGKELIARALHQYSLRRNNPWIDVNTGALPEHLVESELFGYEKGAFSGAESTKQGLFELAHTGTLFLDEIGELEGRTQVKLLRVLDGTPYYRLGGVHKVSVDVRVIAATCRDLGEVMRGGAFRHELYYRLSQIHLKVPPLRERPEDIRPLSELLLRESAFACTFSSGVLDVLQRYSWPGNVRELRNVVVRASVLATGPEITVADLPAEIHARASASNWATPGRLREIEQQVIIQAFAKTGGSSRLAAAMLGISKRTVIRKLRRYGIGDARSKAA